MKKFAFTFIICGFTIMSFSQELIEICNNGYDDDNDGLIDCEDSDCQYSSEFETGCNCSDGLDNDSDGRVDVFDWDCRSYYGYTFIDDGDESCVAPSALEDVFSSVEIESANQNSSDTNGNLIIGDVDCDGNSDAVVVSKWAQSIKIMALTEEQSFDNTQKGEVKAEYNAPGKSEFPSGAGFDSHWYFERDLAISNIDVDNEGISMGCDPANPAMGNPVEIFGFASNRNSADSEPSNYVLIGLSYSTVSEAGTLSPISSWQCDFPVIGTQRPGEISLADFDGDNIPEIYFKDEIWSTRYGCKLAEGSDDYDWNSGLAAAPLAVDIIPGGNLELIAGNIIYSVPDLPLTCSCDGSNAISLTAVWNFNSISGEPWYPRQIFDTQEYGITNYSSVAGADLDLDNDLEIILTGAKDSEDGNSAVFVWDFDVNNGGTKVIYEIPSNATPEGDKIGSGAISISNIDGDEVPEMVFASSEYVIALEYTGSGFVENWSNNFLITNNSNGGLGLTLFDFDLDGKSEIVVRDQQTLKILDGTTGTELFSSTCQSHTRNDRPIISDVDGDGSADICVSCNTNSTFDANATLQQQALGAIKIYSEQNGNWSAARSIWNQSSYFITNISDNLTVPSKMVPSTYFNEICNNSFNTFNVQTPLLNGIGCTSTSISDFDIELTAYTPLSNADASDGSITIEITGNNGDVEILWSNGEANSQISNLTSGFYEVTVTNTITGCSISQIIEMSTEPILTSITQWKNQGMFKLYPNPAKGEFYIDGPTGFTMRIVTMSGKEIGLKNSIDGQVCVDTQGLQRGLYLVVLELKDTKVVRKLLVE